MVFENAVSQVLNQFLGDFVENLDAKQLNIGIWGGDVELKNLVLKPSALDDLDLPIQTVYGTIGKLVLKIPWKSLYTSPTVVLVEDVYLLAQPNQQVKYDPEKEDKKLLAAKRQEIENIEAKKKAELEKDQPKADPGFVQKLTQQIIKNIQLHITNIHIRYEDEVTNAGKPFALGITLSNLNVESTDSNWKKAIVDDVSKIYKVVGLEGLGLYWNCASKLYGKMKNADMLRKMKQDIATKDTQPKGYYYIFGPINASARLRMNPKPEDDELPYSIPSNHLNLDMSKLYIGITKNQYRDIIALVDSMDRMAKGVPYRKYRPDLQTYKGHYKTWWRFAYKCVLEGEVRRKKQNWDWQHMLEHRDMCRQYGKLYKKQLRKQTKEEDNKRIEDCERKLDLVNIVIIRQRIELETERLLQQQGNSQEKGWFEWMWSSSSKEDQRAETGKTIDILKQFEKEMTPQEKQRLYKAIDYHESAAPTECPVSFVDNSLTFLLRTLEIELKDQNIVLKTNLKTVKLKVETRSSASALKVHMQISDFVTSGLEQDDYIPEIICSEEVQKGKGLLEVLFETNPLDGMCDQRIKVIAQPLKIVYDAVTINNVIDIFKIPQDTSMDQLSAAAGSGFMNVKEKTSTGLAYAIEKHVRLDVNIDFHAPYVVVPYGGKLQENVNVFVVNLGRLKLYSLVSNFKPGDVQRLYAEGKTQAEIFAEVSKHCYDQFHLELSDIQVVVAQGEEDWKRAVKDSSTSQMHLLNPLSLNIDYSKCVIVDDPRLPLNLVSGKLPSVSLKVSDARLLLLVALVTSIPMPAADEVPAEEQQLLKSTSMGSQTMLLKFQEQAKTNKRLAAAPLPPDTNRKEFVQFITLQASFVMDEFTLTLNQQENIESKISELAHFNVKSLEAGLVQKTFETNINVRLGSIGLTQTRNDSKVNIISTPVSDTEDKYLIGVVFNQVDKNCPELHSTYGSCETSLALNFTTLTIILHQEGILQFMSFAAELQDNINMITYNPTQAKSLSAGGELRRSISQLSFILEETSKKVVSKKSKKHPVVVETIKFKIKANIDEISVKFTTDDFDISSVAITGINSDVIVKETYTQVRAKLQELRITDLYSNTNHSLILHGTEGTALTAQVILNNLSENEESQKPDMVVTVTLGGSRIVFLNRFVCSMLNFMNQFQAAQQAVRDASEEAARRAKENMKEAYTKATKISLNINLKAPVIVVPLNSLSSTAILVDLGTIMLENKFLTLNIQNKEGFSAVVDDLDVTLSNLKVSRVELNDKNEVTHECVLLDPVNLIINVKRNLSSSWYEDIPDIYVSGKINTINLMLSQDNYRMVMATLNENLGEGKTDEEEKKASVSAMVVTGDVERVASTTVALVEANAAHAQEKTHVFLKFVFSMQQLIINLYTAGGSSAVIDSLTHSPKNHLGRFSLEGLSVKGRILTDQSIVTSVLLVNCLLDDMRPGREDKLNRLIQRSISVGNEGDSSSIKEGSEPPRSMIDVTFQQKENDTFLDVRIYSFTIILSVEYLMKIADFFSNLEKGDAQGAGKSATSLKSSGTGKASQNAGGTAQPSPDTQMTLNLKLEKPDIILVEHMDNINTNAMILNSEVTVKFRMSGAHQVMSGVIKELQLYTCNYNPEHRAATRGNVLHPVTISLAGSTPEGKGLHLELIVTDVLLNVSPATTELLNRVLVTMSGDQTKTEAAEEEQFNYETMWEPKSYDEDNYWFLKMDSALEATEDVGSQSQGEKVALQELCIVTVPSIVVTVEAGVGNKTLPMLMLEVSLKGSAKNWSSQMGVEGALTLQMGYYNSRLALWEPLIEPVDNSPWELKLELSMNDQEDNLNAISPTSDDTVEVALQQPVVSIDINSDKNLEMTVTKTCLEVLQNLGAAFAEAIKSDSITQGAHVISPFKILNEIGEDVTLLLEQSSFDRVEGESLEDINKSAAVHLQLKPVFAKEDKLQLGKMLARNVLANDRFLNVRVNKYNCEISLPVMRADKRFFMLNYRGDSNENYGIISDVKVEEGVTVITLRSIIQVHNHFDRNIEVYYMTSSGNELELIGMIPRNGSLNIPLKAVYSPTGELFFAVSEYSITCSPYVWKDLQTNFSMTKLLQCPRKDETAGIKPFMIKVIGEIEQVYYENTSRYTMASTCYNVHLRPPVILKNLLPVTVVVCVEESALEMEVKPGDTLQMPNIEPGKSVMVIRLPDYLEKEWSCRQEVVQEPLEFSVWTFNSYDSPTRMSLCLGMHSLIENGSLILSLYCPFWMLNKTGLMLGYRSDNENVNVLHHPAEFKGPIMFSFNAKNFFGKKKTSIRIESGEWSDKFSIDVAGSSGVVACKANDRKYQIGVHNQLTYNSMTKQVTFTPYYVIINDATYAIECQESDRPADQWIKVEPKSCTALWPQSQFEDKLLRLRVADTQEISQPFLYTESHTTLLKLDNKYGGVNVDIQLTEGAVYINIAAYSVGCAPALIINHTSVNLNFWEKQGVQIRVLKPKQSVLYTWYNPSGPRQLVWEKGHKKEIENDLRKDGCGNYHLEPDKEVFWCSFLDGMQRVLLFSEYKELVEGVQANKLFEIINQEISVSIRGVGLSLVNNQTRQEILYLGIASSGVIWETCKVNGRRYKQLGTKESTHIENAYQNYLARMSVNDDPEDSRELVDNRIEVDFKSFQMFRPHKRTMRRTYQTGLWLYMKTSPSLMQLHAKINRLQIDNQMCDCTFPVLLAPVAPPKSVAIDSGIKPFVEVSIVQLLLKNTQIRQFKYFKVLVQEFHVKVDLGFINAVLDLFAQSQSTKDQEKEQFLTDMKLVDEALYSHAASQSIQEQKSFYDLLHFSPLKIHVSFSMSAGSSSNNNTPNFLNVLLQGVGVTLTDIQDVVFKLAYFERDYTFLTQGQLTSEATTHYVGQLVKQLYVLVLGLDVIGNPYGLVVGIGKGFEDLFYEPFQGAIQGPSEFAEGLALGVRSLFGHTVGGAAGAVSRITGAMGKGIAALTFDEDFQRKRREQINKKPSTVQEGMARSGKGLVMGVVDGVTGVFVKPFSGAKEQGVEGFFKGLGKGAVGLVTRPAAGVVDFASGSLEVVKRATEVNEDTLKLRSPRFLQADGLVRPYSKTEADGHKLLLELSKGKYANTDVYVYHYVVVQKKEMLLLTDKRLAYITHNDIFGGWQIEWTYTWQELPHPARVVDKGVCIPTSEAKKKKLFGSNDTSKIILVTDPKAKEDLCFKIESLRSA